GINQLSRAKLLFWLFDSLIRTNDNGNLSVVTTINYYEKEENKQAGRGALLCPSGLVYKRMLAAGFTERDIRVIIRNAQVEALQNVCSILDGSSSPPPAAAPCSFGVFEVDEDGQPLKRVEALHENLYDFDVEEQEAIKVLTSERPAS
ncbi:MAG TPA: hypothetical protein VGB55_02420, partial [Tepidisphaeraceae bacterium]